MLNLEDTIVAQSSASGVSSCGIIRISGQDSLCAIEPLFIPLDFNFAGYLARAEFYATEGIKQGKHVFSFYNAIRKWLREDYGV